MRRSHGFTLMEMITVIAVVVVLVSLVAVITGPAIARSKTQPSCASNLRQISVLYNLYMADNDGAFPDASLSRPASRLYDTSRGAIFRCPMTRGENPLYGVYWDDIASASHPNRSDVQTEFFPDGHPIPSFDPEQDVIVKCLDHAYEGFSRGEGMLVGRHVYNSVGKVLGVRLNGSVDKVSPDSCWEFRYYAKGSTIKLFPNLWRNCDRR